MILEKGPMGWKSPVLAVRFLSGMSGKRFEELFNPANPRVQVVDGMGDLLELTSELIGRLDQLRYPVGERTGPTPRTTTQQTGPAPHPQSRPATQSAQVPMGQTTRPVQLSGMPGGGRRGISVYIAHSHLDAESLSHPFIQSISRSSDLTLYTIQPTQESGSNLRDYPKQVVQEADVVLFLLTQNALSSYWALYELLHAVEAERQQGIQKVLVIGYDLGPSDADKERWRSYYQETIQRNMQNWEQRIDTKIRQSMQEGSTGVAAALTEHRYAIAKVKNGARDIASRFVDSIHPTYSSTSALPDTHELEGWIKRIAA